MGAMESMQGEKMVTKPARNEKMMSKSIAIPFYLFCSEYDIFCCEMGIICHFFLKMVL
jgi:hypothetical protein